MLKMRPLLNEEPEDDLKTIAGANLGKTVSLLQKLSSDKDFVQGDSPKKKKGPDSKNVGEYIDYEEID